MSRQEKRWHRKKKKIEAFLNLVKQSDNCEDESKTSSNSKTQSTMAGEGSADETTASALQTSTKRKRTISLSEEDDTPAVNTEIPNKKDKKKFVEMTQDELKELRTKLKARQKLTMEKPKFYMTLDKLTEYPGSPANVPLFVLDLQQLLLYAVQGNAASYKPRWCRLLRWLRLQQTVIIVLDQVSQEDFVRNSHCFPFISETFEMQTEMITPLQYGRSVSEELFAVPISLSQYKRLKPQEKMKFPVSNTRDARDQPSKVVSVKVHSSRMLDVEEAAKEAMREEEKCSRQSLLLSCQQMMAEKYPLPVWATDAKHAGYVCSKDKYTEVCVNSPIFAMDCEMCITNKRVSELTRVAVINEDLEVVYESLVKPHNPIINYLTEYSGITAKMLKGVTTRLEDVQQQLRNLLPSDAILCGQSLNNDLRAVKMFHPYVIDTSVIYNLTGVRRLKSGLRKLAAHFLGLDIQSSKRGHDPSEDARATMELVQLKLKQGLDFGDLILGGVALPKEEDEEEESEEEEEEKEKPSAKITSLPDKETPECQKMDTDPSSHSPEVKVKVKSDEGQDEVKGQSRSQPEEGTLQERTERKEAFFKRPGLNLTRSFFDIAKESKKTVAVVGPEKTVTPYSQEPVSLHPVSKDRKAVKACRDVLQQHDVVYAELQTCSEVIGEETVEAKQSAWTSLDKHVKKIVKCVKSDSLLVVLMSGRVMDQREPNNALCFVKVTPPDTDSCNKP